MKKQLFFLLLANAFLLMLSPISVYAQCNLNNAAPTNDIYGNNEYMMGQTITAPCAGRLTSFTFYTIGGFNYTATVKLRASACTGSVLSTGSATVTSAGGPVIVSNFSPTPNLTNGASYFIEITSGGATVLASVEINNSGGYPGGSAYDASVADGSCYNNTNHDLRFSAGFSAVVLPIELVSFDANTEGSKNHLTWRTESEKDNRHFDIERSTDGTTFHSIGQVKGNNKPSSYQFVDHQPFATSYYRLRQIDFDGTETVSKVVSVELKGKGKSLAVYPNPVSNVLNVVYTEGSSFQVLNLLGQQVLTGKTAAQVDVSALPQGTYILKVGAEQAKFLKQ